MTKKEQERLDKLGKKRLENVSTSEIDEYKELLMKSIRETIDIFNKELKKQNDQ